MIIKLTKNGQVFIPKNVQKNLKFHEGEFLFVHACKDKILIEKNNQNKFLNQCVFNYGRVSIPAEIRRLLGISEITPLSMKVSVEQQIIFIQKNNEVLN